MDRQLESYDENQISLSPIFLFGNNENDLQQNQFHNLMFNMFEERNEFDNSFIESKYLQKQKSPYNSEENISKKATSINGSSNNSSSNNYQISETKTLKILNNAPNSENSQNLNELNQKTTSEISLEQCPFYSYKKIIELFGDNLENSNKILTGEGKNTKKIENKLIKTEKSYCPREKDKNKNLGKKRKNNTEIIEEKKENKHGRKTKDDNPGEHTKMNDDNLMFKIKSNFNNWLLDFINKNLDKSKQLLKINFQDVSKNINTIENQKFLKMELCEIFSKNVSSLYNKKIKGKDGVDINKRIIEEIMEGKNEKAKKILKMTYKDALDLYRFKENIILKETLGKDIKIEEKGRVDGFLFNTFENEKEKMGYYEADDFVSSLLVMVYNYERWFLLKSPRQKKKKAIEVEIKENQE